MVKTSELRLCKQVQNALQMIIPSLADEKLQNLTVLMVRPAPNTGRLLVTVAGPSADVSDLEEINLQLQLAAAYLRMEIAQSINRRKAPELIFEIV